MQTRRLLSSVLLLIFSGAPAAYGQEKGRVGVTAGYPPAIGVIWHVTDRIALRPDITLTRSTFDDASPYVTFPERTTWATEVGLAALVYVSKAGAFSTYVTPRASYSWSGSSAERSGSSAPLKSTGSGYTVSGSVGGQYAPDTRFSVFGEVGLEFSHSRSTSVSLSSSGLVSRANTWSTRSAVGVVIYF